MYNFVIFASPTDFYRISYNDVFNMDNVRYMEDRLWDDNKWLTNLYRLHVTPKINNFVDLPFKRLWNPLYFRFDFDNNNPLCFIFFGRRLNLEKYGFIRFLKNKYSDAKYVCFFQDLIEQHEDVDIYKLKDVFDVVITYDYNESKKYGIVHHDTVYSYYPLKGRTNLKPSDVYFLGKAKGRLPQILNVYEKLRTENINCEFYISQVSEKDQIYPNEIHYISNMSYSENLHHVNATKCLLDIMQSGAIGYTFRIWEAITYNKKILTNNNEIKEAPFYHKDYISIYNSYSEIDTSFLKMDNDDIDYHYKDNLSPKRFLEFIETYLTRN